MALYKQPCRHCGTLLQRDCRFRPQCGSRSPFVDLCPTCLREIDRTQKICSGCGRLLYVACPVCGGQTFVSDRCDACGAELLRPCRNPRCGEMQFFQNTVCTACGKKMG